MTTVSEDNNSLYSIKNNRNATIKKLKNKVDYYSLPIKKININSIENKMESMITKDYDYNNYDTCVLFSLFIYLTKLTKNKDIILNACDLYKTHKTVIDCLDNYLVMIYNITERDNIYSILLKFDVLPYIDKYYDSSIKHMIVPTKPIKSNSKYFSLQHEFDSNIKANEIILAFTNKVNNTYACFYKFNKPELIIYNKLIDIKLIKPSILYIFNHFTLPITRNGRIAN